MSFLEKQWKLILGICAVVFIVGAGVTIQATMHLSKEKQIQESFYSIEKKYNDYKSKKNKDQNPTAKADKKETPVSVEELAKNLAEVKKELESFIAVNPGYKANQMAALYYAEILREEKNKELALTTLQKVQNNDHGLVNTLVQQQIGQILADTDKCKEAIESWQKIINRKEASFIHSDVQIQQALCYQKLSDFKKAEELLTNVANQKTEGRGDSNSAKEAAKLLRLLQFKKTAGT